MSPAVSSEPHQWNLEDVVRPYFVDEYIYENNFFTSALYLEHARAWTRYPNLWAAA